MKDTDIDLIIFDCDGVLFDSKEANFHYYNHILSIFNRKDMDQDELDYVHSHTATESIKFLFRDQPSIIDKVLDMAKTIDYSEFLSYMSIEDGWKDLIEGVRPPIKTAISTNRSNTMPELIKIFNLLDWFDVIVSALDVKNPKPNPEGVFKILDELKIPPGKAVYIGDSKVDEIIANNSDIRFIAYKNSDLNASLHIDNFYELIDMLS